MTHNSAPHRPAGESAAAPAPNGGRRRAAWLAGTVVLILIIALTLSYMARRALAREALVAWLNARGVEAEANFEALGPRGLRGELRIGPKEAPILTTDRAELSYRFTGPWAGRPLGLELDRVELFGPVILVRWTTEGPSLGQLDPLIAAFRGRAPRADGPSPDIIVHDGLVRLVHAGGQARIHADAQMREGVLVALSGRMEPTRLRLDHLALDLEEARLGLVTRNGRTSASLAGGLKSGRFGASSVGAGFLSLALNAPYPEKSTPLGEGEITAVATVKADSLRRQGVSTAAFEASGSFRGRADGGLTALTLSGQANVRADMKTGRVDDLRFDAVSATLQSNAIRWVRSAEPGLSGDVRLSLIGRGVQSASLKLDRVAADLAGRIDDGGETLAVELGGAVAAAGGWSGLGDVRPDDADTLLAIKRGAQAFSFSAPAVRLRQGGPGLRLGLDQPARLTTASGGRLTLSPRSGAALYADGAGAFDLQVRDGGLPRLDAQVTGYRLDAQGLRADTRLAIETDFGPVRGLAASVAGPLSFEDGAVSLRSASCAPVRIDRFEGGETSVEDIQFSLCPGGASLLSVKGGAWSLSGRAINLSAQIPFLQAGLENGQADLVLGAGAAGLYARANVRGGQLVDAAEAERFNPLDVTGTVSLASEVWQGELALASAERAVAEVRLAHNGATGTGAVEIDTGRLIFAEEGLQPLDLSPMASAIGSPAMGAAQFTGAFRWGPDGGGSAGRLSVLGLDFTSPAGPVRGLTGELIFISLAPLETAAGQELTAEELKLVAPLADPQVTFQLLGRSLEVSGGQVKVGGGVVRIEPMTVPFDRSESWRGELVVESVQLADIVQATPFSDRVSLSARVSGRLPFIVGPDGFRLVQGRLEAIEPGRLSIRRAALTDVSASGGLANAAVEGLVEAAPVGPVGETNTAVEFAYQAMEHLAFDLLDAEVNSLPGGRLGVLFHVRGEHSPPQRQEIRLTLGQLIRRDFLNRELPLPSGTKVDLTLDTSLNLDQLLADYAEAQAARGSGEVQPPEPD